MTKAVLACHHHHLQVQQHLAGGDVLPALRLTLLLATLSDGSCCCPGPLDSPDLVPLEELLKAQQGGGQGGLLAVVPELARMLNTSAAMLQGGLDSHLIGLLSPWQHKALPRCRSLPY